MVETVTIRSMSFGSRPLAAKLSTAASFSSEIAFSMYRRFFSSKPCSPPSYQLRGAQTYPAPMAALLKMPKRLPRPEMAPAKNAALKFFTSSWVIRWPGTAVAIDLILGLG